MALVKCPSCRKRMSSLAVVCSNCGYARSGNAEENEEAMADFRRRRYRREQYQYKMYSYVAMSLAMIGAIPMIWAYIKAMEMGETINIIEHWGVYLVALGFFAYMVIRVLMVMSKRKFVQG